MIIDPAEGQHDDILLPVVVALPSGEDDRFLHEMEQHGAAFRRALEAMRAGVRVAPYYRRPLAEVLAVEAERRAELGDPTHTAWARLAEVHTIRAAFNRIVARLEMTGPEV
jgi:hypothetical protein